MTPSRSDAGPDPEPKADDGRDPGGDGAPPGGGYPQDPPVDGAPAGPIGDAAAPPRTTAQVVAWTAATLAIAAAGGWLFNLWRLPLAWMIGAMTVTLVLALMGVRLESPKSLRPLFVSVLGVMLGSAFTPEALTNIQSWIWSIGAMIVFIFAVAGGTAVFLHRGRGWSPATAYFAAMPGGFGVMVLLAEDFGGEIRRVALVHAVRIMLTVMTIPFWFRFFEGYEPPAAPPTGAISGFAAWDLGVLLACAVAGFYVGKLARLPNAALLGPTLLSAIAHFTGLTEARPPGEVLAVAQVVIGAGIGCRFVGVSLRELFSTVVTAVGIALFMIVTAAGFALGLAEWTGISYQVLWLAYAPGRGVAEMALVSLAMGVDVAFVSTHHMVRVVFMVLTAALLFRWLGDRFGTARAEGAAAD